MTENKLLRYLLDQWQNFLSFQYFMVFPYIFPRFKKSIIETQNELATWKL